MKEAKPTPLLDKDDYWKDVTEQVKENYEIPQFPKEPVDFSALNNCPGATFEDK